MIVLCFSAKGDNDIADDDDDDDDDDDKKQTDNLPYGIETSSAT